MPENIYAITPAPGCGKKLYRINCSQLTESQHTDNKNLCGICQLGSEQVMDCYEYLNETINVFDIIAMCDNCKYKCNPITNEEFLEFSSIHLTNGGQYRYPEFLDKQFSKYIDKAFPHAFVYFITDGYKIKIGHSLNTQQRCLNIQTGNGNKIFFVAVIPCKTESDSQQLEHALHKIYSEWRDKGEWFHIKDYIDVEQFHKYWNPSKYIDEPVISVADYCALTSEKT